MHFKIIKDLSNPSSGSEVAAMVMDEVKIKEEESSISFFIFEHFSLHRE